MWRPTSRDAAQRVVDLHRLMNMLNQFHKTNEVHEGKWTPVGRATAE